MLKHHITKYTENNRLVFEAWLQFDFLGMSFCFSKRRMVLNKKSTS